MLRKKVNWSPQSVFFIFEIICYLFQNFNQYFDALLKNFKYLMSWQYKKRQASFELLSFHNRSSHRVLQTIQWSSNNVLFRDYTSYGLLCNISPWNTMISKATSFFISPLLFVVTSSPPPHSSMVCTSNHFWRKINGWILDLFSLPFSSFFPFWPILPPPMGHSSAPHHQELT